jgi:beta-mannosidase
MIRIFFLFLFFLHCIFVKAEIIQSLNNRWEFREAGAKTKWLPARVPGSIYQDLAAARLIPDPLLFDNESRALEVGTKDWEYRCSFTPDAAQLAMQHALLVFEGLDTYVSVFLNDSLLARSDNMFLPLKVDVRKALHAGSNTILLRFHSPVSEAEIRQKRNGKKYPGGDRTFLRKAAYQWGWDWAPALPGCGIWQGVYISWWNDFRFSDITVVQHELSDSIGVFRLRVAASSSRDTLFSAGIFVNDSLYTQEKITLRKGNTFSDIFIRIKNPKRWWCRDYGDPYLYRITLKWNHTPNREQVFMRGFRTVKIDRDNDGNRRGGFRILLNDKPVYIKGANYIPPSPFPGLISSASLRKSVEIASLSGLNMLRVWGGGLYADSAFMAACDRLGMMVWHDFMFACAMVPFEGSMVNSIRDEVVFHAARLSAHPSLALLCGNNEISEGWFNWGWQKENQLSPSDSAVIWNQYTLLFHITIPSILHSNCPGIPYWESSPMTGWGRPSAYLDGDVHYWGVWWGMQPFENFRPKTGRFVSEYGFQGTPEPYMLRRMSRVKKMSFSDPSLKMHQKHPKGFETIAEYARQYFPDPKDFRSQWYVASVQQAYAMETAISAHRSRSPYNMGTMFWQWNDCWPSVSWSVLDESLRPKAAWYTVKREYKPVHLDLSGKLGDYSFIASLGAAEPCPGTFRFELLNHQGKLIFSREKEVIRFADPLVMRTIDTGMYHVRLSFFQNNRLLAQSTRLLCRPRYLKLANPAVLCKTTALGSGYQLELAAKYFAPWLGISSTVPGTFSDNYFHLEAGENRIITFTPDAPSVTPPVFDVRSLYDVTDHTPAAQH